MLAHDVSGDGPPLLLLHGTPSSRRIWDPVLPALARERRVLRIDLPGFGDSPACGPLPEDWVEAIMETAGEPMPVAGHSMGGWTALELAKRGHVTRVLALMPAGLWQKHSYAVDAKLIAGRLLAPLAPLGLRTRRQRRLALRDQSVDGGAIAYEDARRLAADVAAPGWWPHYRAARATRFLGGQGIDVPVQIVWGDGDRIAIPRSRHTDQLPPHTQVETWERCGHLPMYDQPERLVAAALRLA